MRSLVVVMLVLVLVASLVNGYRSGLVRSLSGIAGIIAGGTVAFFLVPLIGPWIQAPEWRTPVTLVAALVLVLGGLTVGESIGHAIRRRAHRTKLRVVDRVLGGDGDA